MGTILEDDFDDSLISFDRYANVPKQWFNKTNRTRFYKY